MVTSCRGGLCRSRTRVSPLCSRWIYPKIFMHRYNSRPVFARRDEMLKTFKKTKALFILLAALVIVCSIPTPARAQWDPYPWKRVPRTADGKVDLNAPTQRTADGKPDLSGFWMPEDSVKHLLNLAADLKPEDIPLKP